MAPRTRRRSGEGFSLVDLQPVLTSVTSSIADELTNQGVDVDTNALLMGIQGLVNQLVMNNPGMMMASDDSKPPYNLAADFLAMAAQSFDNGDKKDAVKKFLVACECEDAPNLMEALMSMNNASDANAQLVAAEGETPDDEENQDGEDDGEMTDQEIDDLITQEDETPDSGDTSGDDDEEENEEAPMGGTSSEKPVTASDRARRILAAKMSSAGDENARKRAQKLLS